MSTESSFPLNEAHLYFAKAINSRVWTLVSKEERSLAEDEEMVHAAHACLYRWLYADTGVSPIYIAPRPFMIVGHGDSLSQDAKSDKLWYN